MDTRPAALRAVRALACRMHRRHRMRHHGESGRVGYLVLYLMGVPLGVLLLFWVLLGNNILAPG